MTCLTSPYQRVNLRALAPGTRIDGRFKVLEHLGTGGISCVYKAVDLQSNDIVAVKVLAPARDNRELRPHEQRALFIHEARMLQSLCHPQIVHLRMARLNGPWVYLVLDYIPGMTLEQFLRRVDLPLSTALRIGDKIAQVLEDLHAQYPPVLYLDLKPANIILDAQGHVHLVDFGTARWLHDQPRQVPSMGTPGYAPPEQHVQWRLDERADLHALGQVCWDLIGDVPVSPGLQVVLDRATAPLPWQRYASVADFRSALQETRTPPRPQTFSRALFRIVFWLLVLVTLLSLGLLGTILLSSV